MRALTSGNGLVLQGLGLTLDLGDAGLHVAEALGGGLLGLDGVATSELVGDLGGAGDGVQGLHGLGDDLGLSPCHSPCLLISSPMVSSTGAGSSTSMGRAFSATVLKDW